MFDFLVLDGGHSGQTINGNRSPNWLYYHHFNGWYRHVLHGSLDCFLLTSLLPVDPCLSVKKTNCWKNVCKVWHKTCEVKSCTWILHFAHCRACMFLAWNLPNMCGRQEYHGKRFLVHLSGHALPKKSRGKSHYVYNQKTCGRCHGVIQTWKIAQRWGRELYLLHLSPLVESLSLPHHCHLSKAV